MNSDTKTQLFELIEESGPIAPSTLSSRLHISPQMVHRHLKNLLKSGDILKLGSPPKVLYTVAEQTPSYDFPQLSKQQQDYIDEHYLAVKPDGQILEGLSGFQWWSFKTNQHKKFNELANEYITNHKQYNEHSRNKLGVIDATSKIKDTFDKCYLNHLFYQSFYSLPKFGKTKEGQMITLGKSGQDINSIEALAELCRQSILDIITRFNIDGVIFTPHSIPRKIAFLKEFKRFLALPYPSKEINKIFAGKIPIAQKSLAKLADRIENAENTIFLKNEIYPFKRVLVIDDAVGSGATLNTIAKKLKAETSIEFVVGFAVTGSLKGFDIISEI